MVDRSCTVALIRHDEDDDAALVSSLSLRLTGSERGRERERVKFDLTSSVLVSAGSCRRGRAASTAERAQPGK